MGRTGFGRSTNGDYTAMWVHDFSRKPVPAYEFIEFLDRGGMGAVYRARQRSLNRMVAIKMLPPANHNRATFVERFKREAQLVASLHHPNIVSIHDFRTIFFPPESEHKTACMVMDYVEGQTLAGRAGARRGARRGESQTPLC